MLVAPAQIWRLAHPAGTHRESGFLGRSVGVRGERGKLLLQVLLAARRAHGVAGLGAIAHQLLELGSTVFAQVFENRHGYSKRANAILSTQARTSLGSAEKLFTRIENASMPRSPRSAYPDKATERASVPVLA